MALFKLEETTVREKKPSRIEFFSEKGMLHAYEGTQINWENERHLTFISDEESEESKVDLHLGTVFTVVIIEPLT